LLEHLSPFRDRALLLIFDLPRRFFYPRCDQLLAPPPDLYSTVLSPCRESLQALWSPSGKVLPVTISVALYELSILTSRLFLLPSLEVSKRFSEHGLRAIRSLPQIFLPPSPSLILSSLYFSESDLLSPGELRLPRIRFWASIVGL